MPKAPLAPGSVKRQQLEPSERSRKGGRTQASIVTSISTTVPSSSGSRTLIASYYHSTTETFNATAQEVSSKELSADTAVLASVEVGGTALWTWTPLSTAVVDIDVRLNIAEGSVRQCSGFLVAIRSGGSLTTLGDRAVCECAPTGTGYIGVISAPMRVRIPVGETVRVEFRAYNNGSVDETLTLSDVAIAVYEV